MFSPSFPPFSSHTSCPTHPLDSPTRPRRRTYPRRRPTLPYESSGFSFSDPLYSYDTDTPPVHGTQPPYFSPRSPQDPAPVTTDIDANLHQLSFKVPRRIAEELGRGKCDVLLLPLGLVYLRLQIYSMNYAAQKYPRLRSHSQAHPYVQTYAVRAAVAGNLCLRDITQQLLPITLARDARLFAKLRGVWWEVEDLARIDEMVSREREEVEVRVEVGDAVGLGMGVGREGKESWEGEVGVERMRWWWS